MSLDKFDEIIDQEMIPSPSESFEFQIPIEKFDNVRAQEKEYLNDFMRLKIMFSLYLPQRVR